MSEITIENPTYMAHIRHFFAGIDLDHMSQVGIDLSTYENLKARSTDVYFQTMPPNANMPPGAERKWSPERSETFENWIKSGHQHPRGEPIPKAPTPAPATRTRRDARQMSEEEIELLKTAFQGMMGRDPEDPTSYFALSGIHWFPEPIHCKHHEDRYNPWHRLYVTQLEDAAPNSRGLSRGRPPLPYWDITTAPPDFLF